MKAKRITVGKAPCKSCPYRRDVPSGVWAADEYDKLPGYDGEMADQLLAGAMGLFDCHRRTGELCAGCLACHGARNLLAFRMARGVIDDAVWNYESPVPVFRSGAAACAHGKREIERPGARAVRAVERLMRHESERRCHQPRPAKTDSPRKPKSKDGSPPSAPSPKTGATATAFTKSASAFGRSTTRWRG